MENLKTLLEEIGNEPEIGQLLHLLKKSETQITLQKEPGGGLGVLLALLQKSLKKSAVYLGNSEEKVRALFNDCSLFCQETRWFSMPEESALEDPAAEGERMAVFSELLQRKSLFLFTTLPAFLLPARAPENLQNSSFQIHAQEEFPLSKLQETLGTWGYARKELVLGKNQFAVRGGILDFFPGSSPHPYRIEWDAKRIESIRIFDPGTQRSLEKIQKLQLFPPESEGKKEALLLDYFPEPVLFIQESLDEKSSHGFPEVSLKRFQDWLRNQQTLLILPVPTETSLPWPFRSVEHFEHRFRDFLETLQNTALRKEKIYVFSRQASRLKEVFTEQHLTHIEVTASPLSEGFSFPGKFRIYTDRELFGRVFPVLHSHPGIPSRPTSREELQDGDIVVHASHGIARYNGIFPLSVEGKIEDYISLSFANEDKLYVPLPEMDRVERYIGPEGRTPPLSKLGSRRWKNARKHVRRKAEEIARDLVELYAVRTQLTGHACSPDTPWQAELEEGFPFQETPDQKKAIEEVKADMESAKPMDRLILGDVGYGKTEVALRAAFKAIMEGKQAAVLVPTTILAQQHYETFTERLATFPVRVEVLSRFRSPGEIREILDGLFSGTVDLLIGTHRILQKDVHFKNLGLIVIDEEQRFGVAHKETLKKLYRNTDVMTLSATPIPRTLSLSLIGIRDISVIETPPEDRLPVKTFVAPRQEQAIRQALLRELNRQGQAYYLYNRIEKIPEKAKELQTLVPEARLATAHGKMHSSRLEDLMWKFMKGFYDILLCTTIIENGLDIPRVNTLIVDEAHRYGLADLYQLRGRVGRADRQAYAYFFLPPDGEVSETAKKRLETLEEFSHLGSGYSISMKDLEMRGAGNLLGFAQSGSISDVGFHLYCQILEEEIRKIKGEKPAPKEPEVRIHLPVSAFIPDEYAPRSQKVEVYRKLASAKSLGEIEEIFREVTDRFGKPPEEVLNLFEIVTLRVLARKHQIREIHMNEGMVRCLSPEGTESLTIPFPQGFSPEGFSLLSKAITKIACL